MVYYLLMALLAFAGATCLIGLIRLVTAWLVWRMIGSPGKFLTYPGKRKSCL